MRRRGYSIAANASFSFFFNALYVVALTWCALELAGGSMSYGTLMAVLRPVGRIQAPVSSLSGMMTRLYQTLASTERLMEVAGLPRSEDGLGLSAAEFYRRFVGVRMRGLAFAYGDGGAAPAGGGESAREVAADDKAPSPTCSDAFVPKGAFVVVEGPSGSGKSTLFKLALGAYNADGFAYELEEGASCAAPQVPAGGVRVCAAGQLPVCGNGVRERGVRGARRRRRPGQARVRGGVRVGLREGAPAGARNGDRRARAGALSGGSSSAWPSRAPCAPARPLWCSTRSRARSTERPRPTSWPT